MAVPGGRFTAPPCCQDRGFDLAAVECAQQPVVADGVAQALEGLRVRAPAGRRQIRSIEERRGSGLQCVIGAFQRQDATGHPDDSRRYSRECVDSRGETSALIEMAERVTSAAI